MQRKQIFVKKPRIVQEPKPEIIILETDEDIAEALADLTPREQEVLSLLMQGAGRVKIAEQLVLSEETVRSHLRHISEKWGMESASQSSIRDEAKRRGIY